MRNIPDLGQPRIDRNYTKAAAQSTPSSIAFSDSPATVREKLVARGDIEPVEWDVQAGSEDEALLVTLRENISILRSQLGDLFDVLALVLGDE